MACQVCSWQVMEQSKKEKVSWVYEKVNPERKSERGCWFVACFRQRMVSSLVICYKQVLAGDILCFL